MKIKVQPMCCNKVMHKRKYDYECLDCGDLCSLPANCAHSAAKLGYCLQCGEDVMPNRAPSCCGCPMYELVYTSGWVCYLCGGVDKTERRMDPTREDEGWTTQLAELIGPHGPPDCLGPVCKYEYAHAPDTTCYECDWVGERVTEECFCYCHERISRNCIYCSCYSGPPVLLRGTTTRCNMCMYTGAVICSCL
jgi:hypothetical protein